MGAIPKILEDNGISPVNIELVLRSNPEYPQQSRTTVPTLCIDVDASNIDQTQRWPGAVKGLVDLLRKQEFQEVDIEIVGMSYQILQYDFLLSNFENH